jgi:hypothetical protein
VEWRNPNDPVSDPVYELYDTDTDPHETRNHAAEHPEIVKHLASKLATPRIVWRKVPLQCADANDD